MSFDFDLFVIGAGSGGVRASRIAGGYGARVAIAEESLIGGTCVVRGCIPKKLLVHAAHYSEDFEDAEAFGWHVGDRPTFSWPKLIANKDREIARLTGLYRKGLEGVKATIFEARATVSGPNSVLVDGREITAGTILVAAGGRPVPYVGEGAELAITSDEAFHLPDLPPRVAVLGGGYIAVEFAGIFNGLGSKTTLIYRGDKVLRGFDDDLRDTLGEQMVHKGIDLRCGVTVLKLEKTAGGIRVALSDGSAVEVDCVLAALGRAAHTRGLGLENAGVALGEKGEVKVDLYSRTNVASIYAVGDVTDRLNLTPVAIREGHAFADTVFGNRPVAPDHMGVATAVFSQPPIGTVGLTEAEARAKYGKVDIYKARFRPLKHTLTLREERTLMKLVVEPLSDRVVGAHMIGADSAEIIQGVAIAMKMGATKAQFDQTVAIHPTAAEEFVTMRTKEPEPQVAARAAE
ncbi:glutathione-disulfide reductase [Zavarzinia sp. CC-PAN008]|uniref:glutathione-disulfide reductase n=1 Tax=Zavarzinia sp. CC-PAN008 TaxID=3243332 RepID=UPI003F742B23